MLPQIYTCSEPIFVAVGFIHLKKLCLMDTIIYSSMTDSLYINNIEHRTALESKAAMTFQSKSTEQLDTVTKPKKKAHKCIKVSYITKVLFFLVAGVAQSV
jgi:hypothetical protein